jgi:hypothetical protein
MARSLDADAMRDAVQPAVHQQAHEVHRYGHLVRLPIGLSETACRASVEALNQVLADTMTVRDLYKKHHWQVAGADVSLPTGLLILRLAIGLTLAAHGGTEAVRLVAQRQSPAPSTQEETRDEQVHDRVSQG